VARECRKRPADSHAERTMHREYRIPLMEEYETDCRVVANAVKALIGVLAKKQL
jgi:hypothetical protein